jgi:hypothetical protein
MIDRQTRSPGELVDWPIAAPNVLRAGSDCKLSAYSGVSAVHGTTISGSGTIECCQVNPTTAGPGAYQAVANNPGHQ